MLSQSAPIKYIAQGLLFHTDRSTLLNTGHMTKLKEGLLLVHIDVICKKELGVGHGGEREVKSPKKIKPHKLRMKHTSTLKQSTVFSPILSKRYQLKIVATN